MSHAINIHDASGIAITDGAGHIIISFGTSVPGAVAGYAVGALFIKTNGAAGTLHYVNAGTTASASFQVVANAGIATGAALTAAKPAFTIADAEGTPDEAISAVINSSAFGFAEADELITFIYKVQNLHVRVGEIEARLEAAKIVAAN